MGKYILRRLIIALPSLLGISLILFVLLALAPGDPFGELATNSNIPPEVRAALRVKFGIDDPILIRYVRWLVAMLHGDWGFSFSSRIDVDKLILQRVPTTLFVVGSSQILALAVALPVGVFAAIAATVGGRGLGILFTLGKLIVLMYAGLILFVLIVIVGVSYLIRVPFLKFARAIREPFLIAFTTASSEAALPKALEVMERFGVPNRIVAFVVPLGYSFNLDGTTLYLSLASVFVAQLAGVDMTIGKQVVMMLTLMLASKGVAGVPRGALVVLAATLTQFNLPLEGAAILLGIDQIMDMGRTAVNVMGNCIAAAVVARWEGVKI